MTHLPNSHRQRLSSRGFLFSPASCYPRPAAYVVDEAGSVLHTWSNTTHQLKPEDNPPNYLRGWNHVELGADGSLFVIVPLRALLKLTPESKLEWACDVAAHHDIAVGDDGMLFVLTEAPRRVEVDDCAYVILDNLVKLVDPGGAVKSEVSLYDILRTDSDLRQLIDEATRRRSESFRRRGWPTPDDQATPEVVQETQAILRDASYHGELRRALQRLRALPGSPCDVLHTNTLELLNAHPEGIWDRGDLLICMRELNTVAVIDPARGKVRWWWSTEELSGPHQPSALPDGRILVYDNGVNTRRTRLVVVDPNTREIVWNWTAQPPESFFCPLAGGCERLANGNLLVTNSTAGEAFELTMDGQIVWRLTLPVSVYGAEMGRVSIYRMSAVEADVIAHLPARTDIPTESP
jgi:Arylsulfotransferase (ASST)